MVLDLLDQSEAHGESEAHGDTAFGGKSNDPDSDCPALTWRMLFHGNMPAKTAQRVKTPGSAQHNRQSPPASRCCVPTQLFFLAKRWIGQNYAKSFAGIAGETIHTGLDRAGRSGILPLVENAAGSRIYPVDLVKKLETQGHPPVV